MTNDLQTNREQAASADEDALLQSVLSESDRLLTQSLREDERRRRVRRIRNVTLLIGGIAMGTAVVAVLAGWLTLFTPPPDAANGASAKGKALSEDAKIEKAEELSSQGWKLW